MFEVFLFSGVGVRDGGSSWPIGFILARILGSTGIFAGIIIDCLLGISCLCTGTRTSGSPSGSSHSSSDSQNRDSP